MKRIAKLKAHKEADKRKKFAKKLLKIIPELKPYVAHRLSLGQALGIIPENMYETDGIIDEAVLRVYESDISMLTSTTDLRILLFKLTKEVLDKVFYNEKKFKDSVSTDKILHQELNKLRERFTFNADEDFVMQEELNDISYHQKDFMPQLFLYEDSKESVMQAFGMDYLDEKRKRVFAKLYNLLSVEASNIVDLHIFGKLNTQEIAQIENTEETSIRDIILQVKDRMYLIITQELKI